MTSGTVAQDKTWKGKEQSEEARYIHAKEQEQLLALRNKEKGVQMTEKGSSSVNHHDFEGGFGGQEDLEDRYATTSGEH